MATRIFCGKNSRLAFVFAFMGIMSGFAGHLWAAAPLPKATNLWSFSFVSNLPYNSSISTPAIALDGMIYLGTFDGTFFAITPDGKEKWRFKAGCEIKSSPAVADDGTIYFGSRDRKFYALTPAGKLKWIFPTGAWVDSSPAIAADGTIYFGGWDKNFYALNPDGSLKWKFAVGNIVDSSPAIAADGTVYFGAHDKKLYALNPDGRVRWTFLTDGAVISSPAIGGDGNIYFSSTDGNLYSVKSDGSEQWHYHTGGMTESSPVLDEADNIYLGVNQNVIQTFSPAGKFRWLWPAPVLMDESVAVVNGQVYTSMPWRMMYALRADDETSLWHADANYNLSASPVISPDGTIYAVFNLYLYAIRPPGDPLPPAKSSWPMFRANARHTGRIDIKNACL